MSETPELQPCPFCGNKAVARPGDLVSTIACYGCCAEISLAHHGAPAALASEVRAILTDMWNRRALAPPIDPVHASKCTCWYTTTVASQGGASKRTSTNPNCPHHGGESLDPIHVANLRRLAEMLEALNAGHLTAALRAAVEKLRTRE